MQKINSELSKILISFISFKVILEYVIGTSSTASMLSAYIDALSNYKYSDAMTSAMPMSSSALGDYPDFLAFGLCIVITCIKNGILIFKINLEI